MKNIHSQLHLAVFHTLLFLVIAGLGGCGGGGGSGGTSASNSPVASIAIQPAHNKLAVGKSQQFTAIGTYTDGRAHV